MEAQLIIPNLQTELICGKRTVCDENWANGGRDVHNDPFSRLYWIRKGKGEIVHAGGTIALRPGCLFAIPAHTPARYRADGEMILFWIHFRANLFGCLEIFSLMKWDYSITLPGEAGMENFWKKLVVLAVSKELGDSLRGDGMLRDLLARFASSGGSTSGGKFQEIQRFLPAIRLIEQNLHRRIRLEELARVSSLQSAYFCHLFSRTMGQSPVDFINRKRIERAQFLLLGEKAPLKETAAEVGFKDVYYFSRIFRKITGISPARYRMQERHGG